jgi:hypothetical protein
MTYCIFVILSAEILAVQPSSDRPRRSLTPEEATQRMTITRDDKLTDEFVKFRERRGYANRSEAVRDLIRVRLDGERVGGRGWEVFLDATIPRSRTRGFGRRSPSTASACCGDSSSAWTFALDKVHDRKSFQCGKRRASLDRQQSAVYR